MFIIRNLQNSIGDFLDPYITEPYYKSLIEPYRNPLKGTNLYSNYLSPYIKPPKNTCAVGRIPSRNQVLEGLGQAQDSHTHCQKTYSSCRAGLRFKVGGLLGRLLSSLTAGNHMGSSLI